MEFRVGEVVNGWELLKVYPRFNVWQRKAIDVDCIRNSSCIIRECFYPNEIPTCKAWK